jgi:hypothetical protein
MKSRARGIFFASVMLWMFVRILLSAFFWGGGDMVIGTGVYVVLVFARVARLTVFLMLTLFSNCKIEVSVQNLIQLCTVPFMYVITLA